MFVLHNMYGKHYSNNTMFVFSGNRIPGLLVYIGLDDEIDVSQQYY